MKYSPILFLILILSACETPGKEQKKEEPFIEGGNCYYDDYKEIAYVSGYAVDENDSLTEVNFTFIDQAPTGLLCLKNKQIKTLGKGLLTNETVKDTTIRYILEGKRITKGSCYPYHIDKVTLEERDQ